MADLYGAYNKPGLREWFDSLPNKDYWARMKEMSARSLAEAKAEHEQQRQEQTE